MNKWWNPPSRQPSLPYKMLVNVSAKNDMCHMQAMVPIFLLHFMTFISMLELAAKPVTTVWGWLSAFGSVKPLDSFYKGLRCFNIRKVKPRDVCYLLFNTGPQSFNICRCEITRYFRGTSGQIPAVFVVTKKQVFGFYFKAKTRSFPNSTKCFFLFIFFFMLAPYQTVRPNLNLKKCKKVSM